MELQQEEAETLLVFLEQVTKLLNIRDLKLLCQLI